MAVYGFKDNKCKEQVAKIYGQLTDEFPSGTIPSPGGIAAVGNNMETNSIAMYHVDNNSDFPGSGTGTILAFKTKNATYKNYMFFDTANDALYFLAANGTSKSWKRALHHIRTIHQRLQVPAGEEAYASYDLGDFPSAIPILTYEYGAWCADGHVLYNPVITNVSCADYSPASSSIITTSSRYVYMSAWNTDTSRAIVVDFHVHILCDWL